MPREDESQPVSSPQLAGQPQTGVPALPGEECQIGPYEKWSEPEKWVWQKTCGGQIADFSKQYGLAEPLNPKDPNSWDEIERNRRLLSPEFLETILLHQPWRGGITRLGLRIVGAIFAEPLDLSRASVDHRLWLDFCLFERKLNFEGIRIEGYLSLEGSALSQFTLERAVISGGVNLDSTSFQGDVTFAAAKIGGQLSAENAVFKEALNMGRLAVGGGLFIRSGALVNGPIILVFANVAGNVDLSDAQLTELDLTGASITGELRLGSADHARTRWQECGSLVLRNTRVGAIQDRVDREGDVEKIAWPKNLQLEGFTYGLLGGLAGRGDESDMLARKPGWYVNHWLEKNGSYSPQPYEQLASVFRAAGHTTKSNDILFASREGARGQSSGFKWLGLSLLKVAIGYGLGTRYFWALRWVALFTILGAVVHWLGSGTASDPDVFRLLWLSFDQLLPVVTLDADHANLVSDGVLERWALAYFYLHKLLGWLLGSFLVAGLAGLTQK